MEECAVATAMLVSELRLLEEKGRRGGCFDAFVSVAVVVSEVRGGVEPCAKLSARDSSALGASPIFPPSAVDRRNSFRMAFLAGASPRD
jgi:hypothetical protein